MGFPLNRLVVGMTVTGGAGGLLAARFALIPITVDDSVEFSTLFLGAYRYTQVPSLQQGEG
jgi:hypothetical protein